MNTKLRTNAKNYFEKYLFKLMKNSVFGKTMGNVRKHRDIKLVTKSKKRNKLASEPNYHTTKYFSENLIVIEMKKTKVKMNKLIYLGMSILDISKTLMYEFWYDYIKPKYQYKAKYVTWILAALLFILKLNVFTKTLLVMLKNGLTHNYDENDKRPLPVGKNKKVIGLFKDELGGKITIEFVGLRAKKYAYLMVDDSEHKKAKGTKKCVIKRRLLFKNYKDCLFNNKIILKSQQRFKSDYHIVCTEQINKIALSSNDNKRLQTFDKITTYPYGTNAFKVCESEMLSKI